MTSNLHETLADDSDCPPLPAFRGHCCDVIESSGMRCGRFRSPEGQCPRHGLFASLACPWICDECGSTVEGCEGHECHVFEPEPVPATPVRSEEEREADTIAEGMRRDCPRFQKLVNTGAGRGSADYHRPTCTRTTAWLVDSKKRAEMRAWLHSEQASNPVLADEFLDEFFPVYSNPQ